MLLYILRQSLEAREEKMVTGEEDWDRGGRHGQCGMATVVVAAEEGVSTVAEESREADSDDKVVLNSDGW